MRKLIYSALLLMAGACSKFDPCDCFKSTGQVISEDRNVGSFHEVYLEDNVNLYITQDTQYRVRVQAGKNLIAGIKTNLENGQLHITNNNSCNWVRNLDNQIDVFISLPALDHIIYKGCGRVESLDTLSVPKLLVEVMDGSGSIILKLKNQESLFKSHEGAVDYTITGFSDNTYIFNNGLGPVDCRNLNSGTVYVINQGTNDCYVRAGTTLTAEIDYIGNICYWGHPLQVISKISGDGRLLSMDK